ncbi:MAG: ATP-binding protein [Nitrospirae bacterium]|nr:ATP-binding protein [Nitrospirota bacterium]
MPFNSLQEKDFIGRLQEQANLFKRVLLAEKGQARSAVLSGQRGIGKTELLKHLFGQLFWKQDRVVPFWYSVNPALLSVTDFSKNYLARFICQRLAFPKKDQALFYQDGISIDDLSLLVEEREAFWAKEILDQYMRCSGDPLDALRIALAAPHRSTLSTGMPVAVLIDDFQLIQGLHLAGVPDQRLASLFQEPMTHRKTPHIISGNMAELQEMPGVSGLERIQVYPLGPEATSSMVLSLLNEHEAEGSMPPLLIRHLGGNPYYLGCIVNRVCEKNNPGEKDFWNAYIQEIMEGTLAHSWSSVLKSFFLDLGQRRTALAITSKIYHTSEALSCQRIAKVFALTDSQAHAIVQALYLAGFIRGEFGTFRAMDDRVLRDIVDSLFMREILAKSAHDLEGHFIEALVPQKETAVYFEMTLPIARDAELIVAQSLEQIGKNLNINQEAIGQLQIAVIEACINAMEHGRGMDDKVYISITAEDDHLEVSIESAGQEFIIQETGEPYRDQEAAKTTGRGWGLKLIKRFVDQVKFEKTKYGTKIKLVKKIERSAGIHKEDTVNHE